ncbi:MAG: carbon starvation protein A [Candidatus Omnitrophica bacterium]|nr:carbon starvation protein A [Candidatus Omnitrophota bacterium]
MRLIAVALGVGGSFAAAYLLYGRRLARALQLNADAPTPATALADGVDFVPAKAPFLLGQHFSAIAAAGPIVGPILAGVWYGWLPALLWIVLGAVFLGAVHDCSALVGSVRHQAASVVEIVRQQLGRRAHLLFLTFVWLSLIYVITAFTDLTSASFVEPQFGGGVAMSSAVYLVIGLGMGVALRRFRCPLWLATAVGLPLVGLAIWYGQRWPLALPAVGGIRPALWWDFLILAYCGLASVLPVWLLLQPRGYLGGFFLYGTLGAGLLGILVGGDRVLYPAFRGFTSAQGLPLFPFLFVTVACGACSGFHGLVSSGTTSKQIARETDCRLVGYGGMLLEGLVAGLALSTVMLLAPTDPTASLQPDRIYANGLSHFVQQLGIPQDLARAFVLLAFATFIYDTLDVATRLSRYILQELTGWQGSAGRWAATLLTLALPAVCVTVTMHDAAGHVVPAWKVFWTIFGTSNQLLAALTLLGLSLWLRQTRRPWLITALPMAFMLAMTLWSLVLLMRTPSLIAAIAGVLALLAVALLAEAVRVLRHRAA